jgi:hypothetical protein
MSRFLVLRAAVASAPNASAICTASVLPKPDAPPINTYGGDFTQRKPRYAGANSFDRGHTLPS